MKFGEHSFRFAGPDTWNSLLSHLHCITDTADFKHKLILNFFDKHLTTEYYFCFMRFIILMLLANFVER